jgi:hypothetical protein
MLPFRQDPVPPRERAASECSSLFGFGYAKQVAAFAAGIRHPEAVLPSAGPAAPLPCHHTPEALAGSARSVDSFVRSAK